MLEKENTSSHRVVGKFFANSTPPSFEETEQSLREQWVRLTGDMTVQKQPDSDMFMFEFKQQKDKEFVLTEGPFNVNGVILVIKDPDSSETIDFTVASFFVAIQGFPPDYLSEENIRALQSEVGAQYNPFILEKVIYTVMDVNLKKPLKPGFYLNQNRFLKFKYWNLGDFCYTCGMIDHTRENCNQVKSPKERSLNATSSKQFYGPWLRLDTSEEMFYETVLIKSKNGSVGECEKTLLYPQFFIELEFNTVFVSSPRINCRTESTHRFRFPSSYLDTETESTKAYEVMLREIYENKPFSFSGFDDKHGVISDLVERLKLIYKYEFCSDDKWLALKLQFNIKHMLTPVEYETMLLLTHDKEFQRLIKSKVSDLIKRRVEEKEDLLCLSTWENQIRQVMSEVGLAHYIHLLDVSGRANKAMEEAVQMELSSSSCPIPAERSTFSTLEHFKVLGSDMDRLDPCMICAGEMFLAEAATVLPCSHVFHSSCIEKWLQVGHKCPLCCFKLPSRKPTISHVISERSTSFDS